MVEKRRATFLTCAAQHVEERRTSGVKTLVSTTGGAPIDVVFDPVRGDISPVAFRTLGWRGHHLVVGFAAGAIPALPMNLALLKGASLVGLDSAQIRKREPEVYDRIMKDLVGWLEAGSVEAPPISAFPFESFFDAFGAISSRRALGKIVVEMSNHHLRG